MSDSLKDLEAMSVIVKEFRSISKQNRVALLTILTKEHEVLGDKLEDPFRAIREQYIGAGRTEFVQSIAAVRKIAITLPDQYYYGLKEAKELVQSW